MSNWHEPEITEKLVTVTAEDLKLGDQVFKFGIVQYISPMEDSHITFRFSARKAEVTLYKKDPVQRFEKIRGEIKIAMSEEERRAYEWSLNQSLQTIAGRVSHTLAKFIERGAKIIEMTEQESQDYDWAIKQQFHSVAADYARRLAKYIERIAKD